jgi:endonuclease/exonuclease/phosphatase family metal-dependent hydrolase
LNAGTGQERRVVLAVELDYSGEPVVVFVTHVIAKQPGMFGDDRDQQRLEQVENLVTITQKPEYAGKKEILMGDLNGDEYDDGRKYAAASGFVESSQKLGIPQVITFPWNGTNKDAIMPSSNTGFTPIEMTRWGGKISDHCGITITYEVPAHIVEST